jgi:hypothetical protein
MIERRLEELNKHADGEERRMDLRGRGKLVRDLISSNAREAEQDFGTLDQHMKELREIDKELQAVNRLTCSRTSRGWPAQRPRIKGSRVTPDIAT